MSACVCTVHWNKCTLYRFEWDGSKFAPDFTISPTEGYISQGMDVQFNITFHPRQINSTIRYEVCHDQYVNYFCASHRMPFQAAVWLIILSTTCVITLLVYWHCLRSMWSGVYVMVGRPSVCTFVYPILNLIWSFLLLTVILIIISFPSPTLSFHSRLKTFLLCKSFALQPFFFFFRTDYTWFPRLLLLLLSISVFTF